MRQTEKWNKFYVSKLKYPTKIIRGSKGTKGGIRYGHKRALEVAEKEAGRKINLATRANGKPMIRTAGGNWVFYELREAA